MNNTIDKILFPFKRFVHTAYASGIILFAAVVIALVWVNSPFHDYYHHLWETHFTVGWHNHKLDQPLHFWINDGLMAIFFFVIGLELKREFMVGELSTLRKALLPMTAALGGMVIPAIIFSCINYGLPSAGGWGIPMATDIAFAIGLLTLAGNQIPASLKVFLTALAVADDLGAVLVIAIFYSSGIDIPSIITAVIGLLVLVCGNLIGIRKTYFYAIIGIVGVWAPLLVSGLHATIAGVLVAFTIPARTKINEKIYYNSISSLIEKFKQEIPINASLISVNQHEIITKIKKISDDAETPLQELEHTLHPVISFIIMPVFALANAGVVIHGDFINLIFSPVSIGIILGLVLGKLSGIFFFTYALVKLRLGDLPLNANWKHIAGTGLLAGVGFTMSLFITNLAFSSEVLIEEAKYGILIASLFSGVLGVLILKRIK